MDVDLSKGLLEKMILKWNDNKWVQLLDYENTAFRCKICKQTGHLHGSCPRVMYPNEQLCCFWLEVVEYSNEGICRIGTM